MILGVAAGGCNRGEAEQKLADLRREAEHTADAVTREAKAQRDEAQAAIEKKMAELDRRLQKARELTRTAKRAKAQAERELDALEADMRRLRQRLESARKAGGHALDDVERSIDRAVKEIENALRGAEDGDS